MDRLQRSYKDTPILDELRKAGKIEVHFLKENLILHKDSSGMDIMFWNMSVLMANSYVLSMTDNVKRSQKYNWSQGKYQGLSPLGYLNSRDENKQSKIILDEKRAPIIKKMFEEFATGNHTLKSIWYLAKELNLCSRPTKKRNYEAPISRVAGYDILTNPFYYGEMRIKGELMPHIYPPIVSKALFDKVQIVLSGENPKMTKRDYKEMPFAFRGLVRCSTCGCTITPEIHRKPNGKEYIYLKCGHTRTECSQSCVSEKILLEQLEKEIFSQFKISATMLDLLKKNVREYLDVQSASKASVKRDLTNQIKQLKAKEARLFDFYLDGNIDKSMYETKKAELDKERQELEAFEEKYVDISNEIKETVENVLEIAANASILMKKGTPQQKNELLRLLFEDCVLEGKTLIYNLQKPFDKLIKKADYKTWLDVNSDDFSNLDAISDNVNRFKECVMY